MIRLETTAIVADGLLFIEPADAPERLPPGEYKVVIILDEQPASDWQPPRHDEQGRSVQDDNETPKE